MVIAVVGEMVEGRPALVLPSEQAYVTETPTGLAFRGDTPIEVWGALVSRLIVARQRISFALADAINFGRDRYGEVYAQWVDETGLQETTLMNVAWVGRQVPASRRREGIDFTYHQAVAALEPEQQDALLSEAEEKGWKRYQLRQAVSQIEESMRGGSVDAAGEPVDDGGLPWHATIDDLTDEARAALSAYAPQGRFRAAWVAGYLRALQWAGVESAFLPGRWVAP